MARSAFDRSLFALLAFIVLLLVVFSQSYLGVVSDGRDYYVQARSIVIDHDLDISRNEISTGAARGDARYYPIGTALLWTPFLFVCHLVLGLVGGGNYARDGYDAPYLWTAGFATLTYSALALVMIARIVSVYFSSRLAVIATIAMCAGSFIIWYIAVDAAASHGASLFAVTLFLYLWHRTRPSRTRSQWAAIGAAAGLMFVVRWQDALFALVLVPEIIGEYRLAIRREGPGLIAQAVTHASAGLAGLVVLVPQFWLWHRNTIDQSGISLAYRVRWFEVDPTNVLFSANHGLLAWTPILYAALIGLVVFVRRDPRVALALIVGVVAQIYVNSTLQIWWGGSGFGARRFASCGLAFAMGLAAAIDWARRKPLPFLGVFMASLIAVNAALMADLRAGLLPIGEGLSASELLTPIYNRLGNPFSAPANLFYLFKHGVSPSQYDALGQRVYATLRIDVGEEGDDVFLTKGWWDREQGDGTSFRWAINGTAEIAMPIREANPHELRFRADPFAPPGFESQSVAVFVNDVAAGAVTLRPGWQEYVLPIQAQVLRRNLNVVRFRFSRSLSPLAAELSTDSRELNARFDRIEMVLTGLQRPADLNAAE